MAVLAGTWLDHGPWALRQNRIGRRARRVRGAQFDGDCLVEDIARHTAGVLDFHCVVVLPVETWSELESDDAESSCLRDVLGDGKDRVPPLYDDGTPGRDPRHLPGHRGLDEVRLTFGLEAEGDRTPSGNGRRGSGRQVEDPRSRPDTARSRACAERDDGGAAYQPHTPAGAPAAREGAMLPTGLHGANLSGAA